MVSSSLHGVQVPTVEAGMNLLCPSNSKPLTVSYLSNTKHVATLSPTNIEGPLEHKIHYFRVHLEHRQSMLVSASKRQCKCSLLSFSSVTCQCPGLFTLGDHHSNPLSFHILPGPLSPAQHQQPFPTALSREKEV